MRRRLGASLWAAVLSAAVALPGAGPAGAQTERERLEALRQRGLTEIDRRIGTLTEVLARVNAARRMTAEHKAELVPQLEAQKAGLTALRTKVTADRRLAQLRVDLARVVNDYRVYVLTVPKARGVAVADIVLAAADRMAKLADRLQAAVDKVEDDDRREAAKADLESLRAKVGATRVKVENLASSLLALQPASYPANRPTLESARSDLRDGRTALREAVALARKIVKDLED